MLSLAGAYEFSNPPDLPPPPRKLLAFLAKAFDLMEYDLLHVSEHERALLAKAGVKPRAYWCGPTELEERVLTLRGGVKVGLIVLPPLKDKARNVPDSLVQSLSEAVLRLRASTRLVIAMSAWGYSFEQELLTASASLPDILLGSGPGIGLVGNKEQFGKTLWIRPFAQGKAVERVDILAWPQRNVNFKWTEEQNIRMTLFGLTEQISDDPQVLSLIQSMGTD